MSHSSDHVEPVNAICTVTLEIDHGIGGELETLVYSVSGSGYPGDRDRLTVDDLCCIECGFIERRKPRPQDAVWLREVFWRVWFRHDRLNDGERDAIVDALMAAIEESAYVASGARNPYSRNFDG
jgi:hypothetical protein